MVWSIVKPHRSGNTDDPSSKCSLNFVSTIPTVVKLMNCSLNCQNYDTYALFDYTLHKHDNPKIVVAI